MAIIGEAVNKFAKQEKNLKLTAMHEIISFRNRLIHSYDSIDDSIVWAINIKHLPLLKKEIENILDLKP